MIQMRISGVQIETRCLDSNHDVRMQRVRTPQNTEWQCDSAAGISKLPPELLAQCFIFMPPYLLDRLPILHVSRTWRGAALHFPAVWSTVVMNGGVWNAHRLISLVLANTGLYPIDFQYVGMRGDRSMTVYALLYTHMHHMRSIRWHGTADSKFKPAFTAAAPLLEHLHCTFLDLLSPDFLAGHVGRLRSLDTGLLTLPPSCPALRTLTTLRCTPQGDMRHLLAVCPRLHTLELTFTEQPLNSPPLQLPPHPPPSLAQLAVNTGVSAYEALLLCGAWRAAPQSRLRAIAIDTPYPYVGESALLDGLASLAVHFLSFGTHTTIRLRARPTDRGPAVAMFIRYRRHRPAEISETVSTFLLLRGRSFARLQCLRISASLLRPFLGDVPALPALDELHVTLVQTACFVVPQTRGLLVSPAPPYTFHWEQLDALGDALRFPIATVTLHFLHQPGEPPRRDHALRALERIWTIWDGSPLPVVQRLATSFVIAGFADAAGTVNRAQSGPPCIIFE